MMEKQNSFLTRFFSLWIVCYVLIFIFTSQFHYQIPYQNLFVPCYQRLIPWFGKSFLHLPKLQRIGATGSGDTTFDYVLILVNLLVALLLGIIILLLDYKRKSYRQLYLFVIVIARYFVAFSLLTYGFAKVFNGQFPSNGYHALLERVGNMSPMGILWTFMGASRPYTFITGLIEVIGGTLLLFRRTKTFGALFSMTAILMIVILNFTYDVPVKIFSSHLLLLCIFILSYDWKVLFNFFILHKSETLNYKKLRVKNKRMEFLIGLMKVVLVIYLFHSCISSMLPTLQKTVPPLEGLYTTRAMAWGNKDSILFDKSDYRKWKNMYINYKGYLGIIFEDEKSTRYKSEIDSSRKTIVIKPIDENDVFGQFSYTINRDTLKLNGEIRNVPVMIILTRKGKKDFLLNNRGFHWISEYPYHK